MGQHDNTVAIVTGSSRGIGLGIARRLVQEGGRVVLTGPQADALEQAVAELGGPGHALGIAGRADDEAHQDEVVERAVETFGRLDYLVNNAGINPAYGPMLDTGVEAARKIMEVNVLGALRLDPEGRAGGLGTPDAPGGRRQHRLRRRPRRHGSWAGTP